MPLNAGRLNRRITLQQRVAGVDGYGQPSTAWQDVATVWADIKAPTGMAAAQRLASDREVSLATYSMRIRYRAGITAGMRVAEGTAVFDVQQVIPDLAGREYVDLVCTTGGAA